MADVTGKTDIDRCVSRLLFAVENQQGAQYRVPQRTGRVITVPYWYGMMASKSDAVIGIECKSCERHFCVTL